MDMFVPGVGLEKTMITGIEPVLFIIHPLIVPHLEHQYIPDLFGPFNFSMIKRSFYLLYFPVIENILLMDELFIKIHIHKGLQVVLQPGGNGDPESHFGPVHHGCGNVLVNNLFDDEFFIALVVFILHG